MINPTDIGKTTSTICLRVHSASNIFPPDMGINHLNLHYVNLSDLLGVLLSQIVKSRKWKKEMPLGTFTFIKIYVNKEPLINMTLNRLIITIAMIIILSVLDNLSIIQLEDQWKRPG